MHAFAMWNKFTFSGDQRDVNDDDENENFMFNMAFGTELVRVQRKLFVLSGEIK